MSLPGTIDRPGGFRHKAPFPRPIPPCAKPPNSADAVQPGAPLEGMPPGFPAEPEDLFVDEEGSPLRLDKGFSWEYPLSVHGLMHNVITNAWRGDPYPIDTLMLFMANMAWNSSMNTMRVRQMLVDKNDDGEYKIPFLIVCDAFHSETIAFADIVLPDTTYLERYDAMSMLDRPISEFEGPADSVRVPVVVPKGECRPFQDVIVELATRLKLARHFFLLATFVVPVILLTVSDETSIMLCTTAFLIQYTGLVVERWYFFIEAEHPQNIYYQMISWRMALSWLFVS